MSNTVQHDFDWLVPTTKELLRPDEVALFLGRRLTFVYDLVSEGKLEAFEVTDREVSRKVISRRSVLLVLAEQARENPALFFDRLRKLLTYLSAAQLQQFSEEALRLRAKKIS